MSRIVLKEGEFRISVDRSCFIADINAGRIRPATGQAASRSGLGVTPQTTEAQERMKTLRDSVYQVVLSQAGEPEHGWSWADVDGRITFPLGG